MREIIKELMELREDNGTEDIPTKVYRKISNAVKKNFSDLEEDEVKEKVMKIWNKNKDVLGNFD